MNLITFISALFLIFSIIANFMLKNHKDTVYLKKSIQGYYRCYSKSESTLQDFIYKNHKVKKSYKPPDPIQPSFNKPPPGPSSKKQKNKKPFKKIYPCSQLNILPLLKNGKIKEKKIYNLLKNLIKTVYPKKFYDSKILDHIILSCQNKKNISLESMEFKKEKHREIWYHMMQGTKFYDFEKKIGYPSILEFIKLSDKKDKLCIHKIQKELIYAIFKKPEADKIVFLQENDKKNLRNYLIKKNIETDLYDFTHIRHKKTASMIISQDKKSKISIKHFSI